MAVPWLSPEFVPGIYATMNGKLTAEHVIYRDANSPNGFECKLGIAGGNDENAQNSGEWVHGITDVNAFFNWYYGGIGATETLRQGFIGDRSQMQINAATNTVE